MVDNNDLCLMFCEIIYKYLNDMNVKTVYHKLKHKKEISYTCDIRDDSVGRRCDFYTACLELADIIKKDVGSNKTVCISDFNFEYLEENRYLINGIYEYE